MALKVEGHSTAEIAGLLGIQVETVRATLSFARDKMRQAIGRREWVRIADDLAAVGL